MITLLWSTLAAVAHNADDLDDDSWVDGADCAPDDPTAFPGARERCDGIDNDCDCPKDEETGERVETDQCVDEDAACVDEVLPCYEVETSGKPAREDDPCLLATNPNGSGGCADGGEALVLFGLLALGRRRVRPSLGDRRR